MTHLCAHVANLIFMDKNCLHVEANNYNVILIYLTKVLSSTYRVVVSYSSNLFIIICLGQSCKPLWIKFSAFGIQLIAIIFTKFSTKGVDSDDESTTISFKLKPTTKMSSIVIIHLFCPYKFISVFLPNSNILQFALNAEYSINYNTLFCIVAFFFYHGTEFLKWFAPRDRKKESYWLKLHPVNSVGRVPVYWVGDCEFKAQLDHQQRSLNNWWDHASCD